MDALDEIRAHVAFDDGEWHATDPATCLPTAPGHGDLGADLDRFRELAGADVPAARERGELHAVLRADGCPWGLVMLARDAPFSAEEVGTVASLSESLGLRIREHMASLDAAPVDGGPGLLVFDRDEHLVSRNDDGERRLAALGGGLPLVVRASLRRPGLRTRVHAGGWLVCHASRLRGGAGGTALVIEPASAAELAPLIAEAHGLTAREREITALIAQGHATGEIADELYLSPHTVRDHLKRIFAKLGVSTRGQLVAQLYAPR